MLPSVRRRYLAGFILAAAILAMVGIAIMTATRQFRADAASVAHTYEVIGRIEQVRAALLNGISAQRNFLLTGQASFRREHDDERDRVRRLMVDLGILVHDSATQSERATQVDRDIARRFDYSRRTLDIYLSQGFEAARDNLRSNPGMALSQEIDRKLSLMRSTEERLLTARNAASEASARNLFALGALGIPLSLLIIGTIYVLLSREVQERQSAEENASELNARLTSSVSGLEQVSAELRQLGRYTSMLQSCQNVPEALDVTRRTLSRLLPGTSGTLYLIRESQDYAEAESAWGEPVASSPPLLSPQDCWGLRRDQPHAVNDLLNGMACTHVEAVQRHDHNACSACIPLSAQGVQLGLLYLSAPGVGPMPHLPAAITAAEQLSMTLANLRLQQTLRHQSIRDPLTGLYNRRYLEESLAREIARCERRGLPLAVMMLDLDHFKALNDAHGHDGGDAVLTSFGQVLQSNCREEDIACRYGGEEFTLILPEMDLAAASERGEKIRKAVESLRVQHMGREISGITTSVGIAIHPLHAHSAPLLQKLADEALYRAKHAGRNRVEVAAPGA